MESSGKANRIDLFNFSTPSMRAFHMTWVAFFLCFFSWFGIAPLMAVVREDLALTREQVGWCMIGSVAITILARMGVGWLCDRIGPRLAYTGLLVGGSLPVMGIALAHDFTTFLIFRVAIGVIGASFVITQYHTTQMFAMRTVGTANAVTAGWGNFGGGVTHWVMPLVFAFFATTLGLSASASWRAAMVLAGIVCLLAGIAYYFLTQDTPEGNFRQLRAEGKMSANRAKGTFGLACRDPRVWALFVAYGICFGVELTIDNVAAMYFLDYFPELKAFDSVRAITLAGFCAGMFGGMSCFARALGGFVADRRGRQSGLGGRVHWLFVVLFCEGLALITFSQTRGLYPAIGALMIVGLFVHMAAGATFAVVPFINQRALGSVAGIVGAGGNAGAVLSGFLFKSESLSWPTSLFILGAVVTVCSFVSLFVTDRATVVQGESVLAPSAIRSSQPPVLADISAR